MTAEIKRFPNGRVRSQAKLGRQVISAYMQHLKADEDWCARRDEFERAEADFRESGGSVDRLISDWCAGRIAGSAGERWHG